MNWADLGAGILAGKQLGRQEALEVLRAPDSELLSILEVAFTVRRHYFGMGVTLLETKLMGITAELISQNRSDDADEFSEAATTILNEIKSANDANQLKGEILTQLGELKMLHPGMFADGEIDWTMMCIGKALERREPAIDGKTWQAELAQLRAQIP